MKKKKGIDLNLKEIKRKNHIKNLFFKKKDIYKKD